MDKKILIISSNSDPWHDYESYAREIGNMLEAQGYKQKTMQNLESVRQGGALQEYDAVVFCGHYADRDKAAELELERFVHSGKGLVVVHIASSSFEFSPRWRKLVGRVWEYGGDPPFTSSHPEPPGPFQVNYIDTAHPVTDGLKDFDLIRDERYQDLLVAPNAKTHDLAVATLEGRTEPMAWILTPEGGRVFHVTLGHDLSTYNNPGFQELLKRGVAWAAGIIP